MIGSGQDVVPGGSGERVRERGRDGDQRRDDRKENEGFRHEGSFFEISHSRRITPADWNPLMRDS